jgi:hypothetical protein
MGMLNKREGLRVLSIELMWQAPQFQSSLQRAYTSGSSGGIIFNDSHTKKGDDPEAWVFLSIP